MAELEPVKSDPQKTGVATGTALKDLISPESGCHDMPSHEEVLVNLRRIEGQIRGIMRMIEDRRYCLDILNQCSSVHAALGGVEKKIFKKFLSVCVRRAFEKGDDENLEPLMDDIVKLLSRK